MVKTLALVLMAMAPLAAADKTLTCAIDGAGAIDSTINAAIYMWASTARCAKGGAHENDIKCTIDIASAVKSVNDMVNIIVGAVEKCGDVNTANAGCGEAAGGLTSAAAGLTAASANVASWVKDKATGGDAVIDGSVTNLGKCIINTKSTANGLFQAAASIQAAQKGCGEGAKEDVCAVDALQIVSVLSGLGSAIAGSVSHCSHSGNADASMSSGILNLVSALDAVASAGIKISQKCEVSDARLFEIESGKASATANNSLSLVLAALLPVAAVLSFVAGRRMSRKTQATRDIEEMAMIQSSDEQ
jgi:hypothetical protein